MHGGSNTRVVLVFPGALGDVVLALPTFLALRARHAGAHVTLAVAGGLVSLVATSGVADAVVSLDDADAAGLFGGTRMPAWLAGRPRVYSWIGARDPDVRARVAALAEEARFLSVVRDEGPEHASVAYAGAAGVAAPTGAFRWPSLTASARVARLVAARPLLVVHGGAGARAKRWAPLAFAELVRRWRLRGGRAVELVGPADADVPGSGAAERAADWPLIDVAALLARCDAYAGNDSGVTHLADAVGARGLAVFGPTSPHRWAPCGGGIEAIRVEGPFVDGIPWSADAVERGWDALERLGCLDNVRGRE